MYFFGKFLRFNEVPNILDFFGGSVLGKRVKDFLTLVSIVCFTIFDHQKIFAQKNKRTHLRNTLVLDKYFTVL